MKAGIVIFREELSKENKRSISRAFRIFFNEQCRSLCSAEKLQQQKAHQFGLCRYQRLQVPG